MVEVESLSKRFKDVDAVNKVSFKVKSGEIVGMLGKNGAGKTTTLRLLATILKPTGGSARINGFDINMEPDRVRSQIGILFGGEAGLYDRLTGRENISYFAGLYNMSRSEANESIDYLSRYLGTEDYIDKRVRTFSRGMKQKVAIARAIVHKPSVMLFDEPTIGLDIISAKIVQDFILTCKEQNKAIIFSSHNLQEIEKLSDRIVIIDQGKIIEDGTLEELQQRHHDHSLENIFIKLVGDLDE
jgi:sodium transport system ATP-binding protein